MLLCRTEAIALPIRQNLGWELLRPKYAHWPHALQKSRYALPLRTAHIVLPDFI
jgi:hypothetical protein